jgi:hypothetical protein
MNTELLDESLDAKVLDLLTFEFYSTKLAEMCLVASRDDSNGIKPNDGHVAHPLWGAYVDANVDSADIAVQLKYLLVHGFSPECLISQAGITYKNTPVSSQLTAAQANTESSLMTPDKLSFNAAELTTFINKYKNIVDFDKNPNLLSFDISDDPGCHFTDNDDAQYSPSDLEQYEFDKWAFCHCKFTYNAAMFIFMHEESSEELFFSFNLDGQPIR